MGGATENSCAIVDNSATTAARADENVKRFIQAVGRVLSERAFAVARAFLSTTFPAASLARFLFCDDPVSAQFGCPTEGFRKLGLRSYSHRRPVESRGGRNVRSPSWPAQLVPCRLLHWLRARISGDLDHHPATVRRTTTLRLFDCDAEHSLLPEANGVAAAILPRRGEPNKTVRPHQTLTGIAVGPSVRAGVAAGPRE